MARYLITGASGFIGGHVAERLASDGHQLRCLVRETSNVEVIEPLGAELVLGSITDRAAVESAGGSTAAIRPSLTPTLPGASRPLRGQMARPAWIRRSNEVGFIRGGT